MKLAAYDGTSLSNIQTITVTINGANDAPTVAVSSGSSASGDVTEDNATPATGTITLADVDGDDTQANLGVRFTAGTIDGTNTLADPDSSSSSVNADASTTIAGTYGTFTVSRNAAGEVTWSYAQDDSNATVNALDLGDTITDSLKLAAYDGSFLSNIQTITVTITGANDRPVLSAVTTGADTAVTEAGGVANATAGDAAANGSFSVTDPDANDGNPAAGLIGSNMRMQGKFGSGTWKDGNNIANSNNGTKITGMYGDLYLKNDGSWTYELNDDDADTQALDANDSETETFKIRVKNEVNSNSRYSEDFDLEVTVNGANDAPMAIAIVPDAARVATQDAAYSLDLSTLFSDPDGDSLSYSFVGTKPSWLDDLGVSDTTLTGTPVAADVGDHDVTIRASDGNGGTDDLTFTITVGTPVVPSAAPVLQKSASDTDTSDSKNVYEDGFLRTTSQGDRSDFDNKARYVGNTVFSLTDPDGDDDVTNMKIYATATGANDAVPSDPYNTSTEIVRTGTNNAGDLTTLDIKGSIVGTYGTLTVMHDWHNGAIRSRWTYDSDNDSANIQSLGDGDTATETFKLIAYDDGGTASNVYTITITLNGQNDGPMAIATVPDVATVATQDAAYSLDLSTLFSDTDGDSLSYSFVGTKPSWLDNLGSSDTTLTGTPLAADIGDHSVTIRASDGTASIDLTFTITVAVAAPANLFLTVPVDTNNGTDDANTLDESGTTTRHLIQGGDQNDTITASNHGDVIIGGYGADTITLGDGDDVVIHRFLSADGQYTNRDGGDVINDFEIGNDKLLLVDERPKPANQNENGPLADWAAFINATDAANGVKFDVLSDPNYITGLIIYMGQSGTVDGEAGTTDAGATLTIHFKDSDVPIQSLIDDRINSNSNTLKETSETKIVTNLLFSMGANVDVTNISDFNTDYDIAIL